MEATAKDSIIKSIKGEFPARKSLYVKLNLMVLVI